MGVRAINAAGDGTPSSFTSATPFTIPGAPGTLAASPADASAVLTFAAADNGGSVITGYQYTTDDGATWKALTTTGTTTLRATITTTSAPGEPGVALVNGTEYTVAVRAENAAGFGPVSTNATVIPARPPDAPLVSSFAYSDASISMTVEPPADDGGAPVTSYEYTTDGGATWAAMETDGEAPWRVTLTDASTPASVDVQFADPVNYTVGSSGGSGYVTFADLDGDGNQDMIAASDSRLLVVRPGNGDGTFASWRNYAAGAKPVWIDTGDINGDGHIDVTMSNRDGDTVQVWLGSDTGVLTASGSYPVGEPYGVAFADFNGDGNLDLVNTSVTDKTIEVRFGAGDGTFGTKVTYATGNFPRGLVTGDLNNDGHEDVVLANSTSNNAAYFLNNGDGTFAAMVSLAAGTQTVAPVVADFNNDGNQDIAVTVAREGPDNVSVWLGNGDGTFGSRARYNVAQNPIGLAAGDLTGDGIIDLVTGSYWDDVVSVLAGNGDGTFAAQQTFGGVDTPYSEALADLNGDGKLDLGVANLGRSNVTIFMNGTASAVQPIVNGTAYSVGVRAVNAAGAGAASPFTSITPSTLPSAPTISGVVAGPESLTPTVTAMTTPEQNGGSPITRYRFFAYDSGGLIAGSCIANAPATSCEITGLPSFDSYTVKARAQNINGLGPLSEASSPVTPLPLPPP